MKTGLPLLLFCEINAQTKLNYPVIHNPGEGKLFIFFHLYKRHRDKNK